MPNRVVAKLWWQAPHDETLSVVMRDDDVVLFGRHSSAQIRVGYAADFTPAVPRRWAEFAWVRGRLLVTNLDDAWGFDLAPAGAAGPNRPARPRMTVPPQASVSPPFSNLTLEASAAGFSQVVHVASAPRTPMHPELPDQPDSEADIPSHTPLTVTDTQRRIGTAMLDLLGDGRSRRPGYEELAHASSYSVRHVRETVQELDAAFLVHGLGVTDTRSDALDRLAQTLTRHPGLLR